MSASDRGTMQTGRSWEGHQREKCFSLPWEGAWSGAGETRWKRYSRKNSGCFYLTSTMWWATAWQLSGQTLHMEAFICPTDPILSVEVHSLSGGLTALSNAEGSHTLALPKLSLMPSIIVIWSSSPLCFQKRCGGESSVEMVEHRWEEIVLGSALPNCMHFCCKRATASCWSKAYPTMTLLLLDITRIFGHGGSATTQEVT